MKYKVSYEINVEADDHETALDKADQVLQSSTIKAKVTRSFIKVRYDDKELWLTSNFEDFTIYEATPCSEQKINFTRFNSKNLLVFEANGNNYVLEEQVFIYE